MEKFFFIKKYGILILLLGCSHELYRFAFNQLQTREEVRNHGKEKEKSCEKEKGQEIFKEKKGLSQKEKINEI